jgi:ribosomal protein S18 acetylase RimI-like enzyme
MTASLRPMREDEYATYRVEGERGYARNLEENGGLPADEAQGKAARDYASLLSQGLRSPGQSLYVVQDEGERVGILWVAEREPGGHRTLFVYDVEIEERFRGRGLGRAAMQLCEEEARRRGIDRIELNVFGGNKIARGLYRSLDYREAFVFMVKDL